MSELGPGDLRDLSRSERVEKLFSFSPYPYQRELLDCHRPEVVAVCGRQVGKTETVSVIPADYALTHAGVDVMIAARFQETANELFRRTKRHLENTGLSQDDLGITTANKTTYEFDNGSRILSRTLGTDASQQRGKLPQCVVVEEAALVEEDVYERVIEPMFATHDDYQLILISTPAGKSGYLWEAWNRLPDAATFHWPTEMSPLVDDDWLAERRAKVDNLTWRQEYCGEFVEEGDAYLPHSLVTPCIGDGLTDDWSPSDTKRYLGVDVARRGQDRTVYIDIDAEGRVHGIRSETESTMPGVVGQIKSFHERVGYQRIQIDENAVGGGVVDFSQEGLGDVVHPVTFTTKSKQEMYQSLKSGLEREDLALPPHDRLRHELTSLQFDFTQHGKLRVHHPPGGHDDFPDALALANYGRVQARRHGVKRSTGDWSASTRSRL